MFHKYFVLFFGILGKPLAYLAEDALPSETRVLVEEYNPICPEDVLKMPSRYGSRWIGIVYVKSFSGIHPGILNVTVNADSNFLVMGSSGDILNSKGRSLIVRIQKYDYLVFGVNGKQDGKIPHPVSVRFNGADLCSNFTKSLEIIENCGKRMIKHEGLITFGTGVRPGDFPWHAAIYHMNWLQRSYKCGGTIINSYTVLTAAHCVYESFSLIAAERIIVQIGKHNFHMADDFTRERQVFKIIPHPSYNTSLLLDDIALLRLSREINYSDYIQPICLWNPNTKLSEKNLGVAVGWGHTENDTISDVLRYVELPVVSSITCLMSDRDFFGTFLTDNNFCAGYLNGTNVCSGDSGGSLAYEDEKKVWRIRGIISLSVRRRSSEICNPKHYVIFTDVAKYLSWIRQESFQ